jgi:thymidine kinase
VRLRAPRYIYLYRGRIESAMAAGDVCGVQACGKEARRSLSTKKVKEALPELKLTGEPRRIHLCKDHYRQFRKKTKQERENERATWQ